MSDYGPKGPGFDPQPGRCAGGCGLEQVTSPHSWGNSQKLINSVLSKKKKKMDNIYCFILFSVLT